MVPMFHWNIFKHNVHARFSRFRNGSMQEKIPRTIRSPGAEPVCRYIAVDDDDGSSSSRRQFD